MSEPRFARPVVVASKCLGFAACRYDGEIVADGFVARLQKFAEILPVCPELEVGLGVPREKIRLIGPGPDTAAERAEAKALRLVQPVTGKDITDIMTAFALHYIAALKTRGGVDGFILKSRSPSCGVYDTKVFKGWEIEEFSGKGSGIFAVAVRAAFPDLAVEDENRLAGREVRHRFLARIFERARGREAKRAGVEKYPPAQNAYPPELL